MLQTWRNSSHLKLSLSRLRSVLAVGGSDLWLCKSSLPAAVQSEKAKRKIEMKAVGVRERDKYGVESQVRTGEI